jgi:hypothetical protein
MLTHLKGFKNDKDESLCPYVTILLHAGLPDNNGQKVRFLPIRQWE